MKAIRRVYPCAFLHQHISTYIVSVICCIMLNVNRIYGQNAQPADSIASSETPSFTNRRLLGGTITNSGYGGVILKFSRFNNQPAFMTGGRGALTINNKYTIGGGGYGIANSIDLCQTSEDSSRNFKMGYGGLETGYLILSKKKVDIGISFLVAAGAAFWQNDPKGDSEKLFDDDFNIFPVFEPSLYGEVVLNRFLWLHTGISYRYIHHAHLDYIEDQYVRGFSCYIGLLFGKPE